MSSPSGALLYLSARTIRNRLAAELRRLRSPRYVVAVAVACGYFVLLFYRPSGDAVSMPAVPSPGGSPSTWASLELLSACGLVLLAAKWWLLGSTNATLAFSPAEVQFLFPAPLSRRTLVIYKIARMQLSLLLSALLITVLVRRAGAHLPVPLRLVGVWLLFCTLSLHQMAAILVRTGAAQRGRGLKHNAVPIVVAGTALLVLAASAARAWPGVHGAAQVPAALARVAFSLDAPLPRAVLTPFRIVLAPSYAETPRAWLATLPPALLLLLAHVMWVLRADTVFEEAEVEASARRAERIAMRNARALGRALPTPSVVSKVSGSMAAVRLHQPPPQPARRRSSFIPLAPTGDPAVALLWKNTLALLRGFRVRTVIFVSGALIFVCAAFRELGLLGDAPAGGMVLLGTLAFVGALFLVVLGPTAVRNDLRQDLLHLDMLRTYPLRGRSIVLAEIASSTLALTLIQWALLAASYVLFVSSPEDAGGTMSLFETSLGDRRLTLALAMAVLPVVNGASFVVQNGAALLFPEWTRLGTGGAGGLEAIGQRILGFGASLAGLGLLLAAPLVLFSVLIAIAGQPTQTQVVIPALVAALAVGCAELYGAIAWLGTVFEKKDATPYTSP